MLFLIIESQTDTATALGLHDDFKDELNEVLHKYDFKLRGYAPNEQSIFKYADAKREFISDLEKTLGFEPGSLYE